MKKSEIVKHAPISAGVTAGYILLIASFITNLGAIFGGQEPEDAIIIPIIMLLVFVISAAVTGAAVFGRPVIWYLDGKKKEALRLLGYTVGFPAIIALFFISIAASAV